MLAGIIEKMGVLELDASALDQPISVTNNGSVATVRQLIASPAASDEVRALFGIAASAASDHVQPVAELNAESLQRVAVEVLRGSDSRQRVAIGLYGDFDLPQLIHEVENKTSVGREIADAVRLNGEFIEALVQSGKVRPPRIRTGDKLSWDAPGFDPP
jgi:hypothetical protein